MDLVNILKVKYPDADFQKDIIIRDDGEGPYILEWNIHHLSKPTISQINKWGKEESVEQQYTALLNNKLILEQLTQLDTKSIRALRSKDDARLAQYEQEAVKLRSQLR